MRLNESERDENYYFPLRHNIVSHQRKLLYLKLKFSWLTELEVSGERLAQKHKIQLDDDDEDEVALVAVVSSGKNVSFFSAFWSKKKIIQQTQIHRKK
jgi:hypothetical protein